MGEERRYREIQEYEGRGINLFTEEGQEKVDDLFERWRDSDVEAQRVKLCGSARRRERRAVDGRDSKWRAH